MGNLLARSALILALVLAPISLVYAQLVTRVVDGDTLIVQGVGRVRLIGVDTPETVDPRRPVQFFGKEASAFTHRMAEGKVVRLAFDIERTDRFGRTLSDGTFLNAEIVKQGYGHAYTQFPFKYLRQFQDYEREAREAGRGLWTDVYLSDGTFLNAEIVKQGYGHAYTQFPFKYLRQFQDYEREAREAGRGLWTEAPAVESPSVMADVRVWVNTASGVYHCPGTQYYGHTRRGSYMTQDEAQGGGYSGGG